VGSLFHLRSCSLLLLRRFSSPPAVGITVVALGVRFFLRRIHVFFLNPLCTFWTLLFPLKTSTVFLPVAVPRDTVVWHSRGKPRTVSPFAFPPSLVIQLSFVFVLMRLTCPFSFFPHKPPPYIGGGHPRPWLSFGRSTFVLFLTHTHLPFASHFPSSGEFLDDPVPWFLESLQTFAFPQVRVFLVPWRVFCSFPLHLFFVRVVSGRFYRRFLSLPPPVSPLLFSLWSQRWIEVPPSDADGYITFTFFFLLVPLIFAGSPRSFGPPHVPPFNVSRVPVSCSISYLPLDRSLYHS